jgi:hypothetical protein
MGRYWNISSEKDMHQIQGGYIKYRVRKNLATDRWELTIRRKQYDWTGLSDVVIQSTSWHTACQYAIDHWNVAKEQGLV